MKILVPTDLSPLARVAASYAAHLSVKLNAQLVVMNVMQIDQPTRLLSEYTSDDLIEPRRKARENEVQQLVKELRAEIGEGLNVVSTVEKQGPLEETINSVALHFGCDLIVMGTKGASGLKKVLFGSNTAAVINHSPIPVLAVPEHAVFHGYAQVVYASDMKNLFREFAILLPLLQLFDAAVQVVHVYQPDNRPQINELTMAENLQKELKYPKISCHYVGAADVKSGIEYHLNGRSADILAMFSGKRNFFERIFEKSNTRDQVFQSRVPLLTFNKKTVSPG